MSFGGVPDTGGRITAALERVEHEWFVPRDTMPELRIEPRNLHAALAALRDEAQFETVTFITCIDHHPEEPRYEVIWQLNSVTHADRVRITARVSSENASVPTCIDLWPGAAFSERECYDMFGVRFDGHEGLKRLLMPDGYGHHPLRKDFPHQGIQPDRLYREWDRERRREWETEEAR